MAIYEKFARKYLEEAERDLERARRALTFKDYPQATFYAQQCTEKAVKAMLEVKKRIVYNHGPELIAIFSEAFSAEWNEDYNTAIEALEYLQEYYSRARYPTLFKGEVYSPSDIITEEIASKAIQLAQKTLEVSKNYLRRSNII